ncbi:MAG: tRNA (guanine(46)-N(7))-methyltransferase TrmB [Verrucomicrobiota bacterium]
MSNLKQNGKLRWAPSYLRNRGKVTRAQKRALREGWDRFGIQVRHGERIDLEQVYDRTGPVLVEIGFGMGEHLLDLADSCSGSCILGIEVHRPALASVTGKLIERDWDHVRLIRGDARLVLTDHLPDSFAEAFFIQFPDPWPKAGDEHRRLVQPGMIEVMEKALVEGGECQVVTDIRSYHEHVVGCFSGLRGWSPVEHSHWNERRTLTRYERKALHEGREIYLSNYRYDG